jgi:formylglycine-generating enzyme required for sulfatase activity
VPAGKFWRGSCNETTTPSCDPGAPGYYSSPYVYNSETPQKEITLSAFALGKYEVTVAEYARCVTAGKCATPSTGSQYNWNVYGRDQHPINGVSWYDAASYANWLSGQQGLTSCYNLSTWEVNWNCSGYRLPTEAEWEKAARGIDGRSYPWGNDSPTCDLLNSYGYIPEVIYYCVGHTAPVDSYSGGVSSYGAYNMAGNVYEWVGDWFNENYYSTSPTTDPTGPSTGSKRGFRGGGWGSIGEYCRTPLRYADVPDFRDNYLGFRLARSSH